MRLNLCIRAAAALALIMLSLGGCNMSRRQPVAAIEPTYSYLRAPVTDEAADSLASASVAQVGDSTAVTAE